MRVTPFGGYRLWPSQVPFLVASKREKVRQTSGARPRSPFLFPLRSSRSKQYDTEKLVERPLAR